MLGDGRWIESRALICKKLRILGWGCDQLNSSLVSLAFRSGGDRRVFLHAMQPIHFGRGIIKCFLGYANLSPFAYASVIEESPDDLGRLCSTTDRRSRQHFGGARGWGF